MLSPAIVPATSASPARSMPSASAAAAPGGVRTISPTSVRTERQRELVEQAPQRAERRDRRRRRRARRSAGPRASWTRASPSSSTSRLIVDCVASCPSAASRARISSCEPSRSRETSAMMVSALGACATAWCRAHAATSSRAMPRTPSPPRRPRRGRIVNGGVTSGSTSPPAVETSTPRAEHRERRPRPRRSRAHASKPSRSPAPRMSVQRAGRCEPARPPRAAARPSRGRSPAGPPRSITSSTASAAAHGDRPAAERRGVLARTEARGRARATSAPIGSPPPSAFASETTSGRDVRGLESRARSPQRPEPDWTSSTASSAPACVAPSSRHHGGSRAPAGSRRPRRAPARATPRRRRRAPAPRRARRRSPGGTNRNQSTSGSNGARFAGCRSPPASPPCARGTTPRARRSSAGPRAGPCLRTSLSSGLVRLGARVAEEHAWIVHDRAASASRPASSRLRLRS